jgi:nitrogen fixation protein FixH
VSTNGKQGDIRRERLERLGIDQGEADAGPKRRRFFPWPGLIFVLIGANMCVVAITVFLATSDKSVAVEPNYYAKGLQWEDRARDLEWSRKLGWKAGVEVNAGSPRTVTLRLTDRDGAAVAGATISLVTFHNARSRDRLEFDLQETEPGVYAATAPMDRAGQWRFRVSARLGADHFVSEFDQKLPAVALAANTPEGSR